MFYPRFKLPLAQNRVPTADVRSVPVQAKQTAPIYSAPEYLAWKKLVISRANGRCQDTECKTPTKLGRRLYADHIVEIRDNPKLSYDPRNGMARCASCHTSKTLRERAKRMSAS